MLIPRTANSKGCHFRSFISISLSGGMIIKVWPLQDLLMIKDSFKLRLNDTHFSGFSLARKRKLHHQSLITEIRVKYTGYIQNL